MHGGRRSVDAGAVESERTYLAVAAICYSACIFGKRKSTELGDHGRVLWAKVVRHTAGVAALAEPVDVDEHPGLDGLDLR